MFLNFMDSCPVCQSVPKCLISFLHDNRSQHSVSPSDSLSSVYLNLFSYSMVQSVFFMPWNRCWSFCQILYVLSFGYLAPNFVWLTRKILGDMGLFFIEIQTRSMHQILPTRVDFSNALI